MPVESQQIYIAQTTPNTYIEAQQINITAPTLAVTWFTLADWFSFTAADWYTLAKAPRIVGSAYIEDQQISTTTSATTTPHIEAAQIYASVLAERPEHVEAMQIDVSAPDTTERTYIEEMEIV